MEDHKLIQISSTHKYKGDEDPVVIVLDAIERSYPLIHPNWIFLRIFGDSLQGIEDAERRLFYVALTRPEEDLYIITEKNQASPYLSDITKYYLIDQIDWDKYPPPPSLSSNCEYIEVQVHNAYDVKDDLKRLGFKWNIKGKYWDRMFLLKEFTFTKFLQQNWINEKVVIKVYSERQKLIHESHPHHRQYKFIR